MISFHLYGLIVGTAAVGWWSLAEKLEPQLKRSIPVILVLALIGARTYHVLEYFSYYQMNYWAILRIWEGGLSIWGALGGGLSGTWLAGGRSWRHSWAVVTPLPLAQAIGRLANAVAGEFTNPVLGVPWWGMEAIGDLGLFGILWRIKKEWRVGVYLIGYGLIRLVLQPYRM